MSPFANDPYCYPGRDVLIKWGRLSCPSRIEQVRGARGLPGHRLSRSKPHHRPFRHQPLAGNPSPHPRQCVPVGRRTPQRHRNDDENPPLWLCGRLGTLRECPRRPRDCLRSLESRELPPGPGFRRDRKAAGLLLQRTRCHSLLPRRKLENPPRVYGRPLPSGGPSARLGSGSTDSGTTAAAIPCPRPGRDARGYLRAGADRRRQSAQP